MTKHHATPADKLLYLLNVATDDLEQFSVEDIEVLPIAQVKRRLKEIDLDWTMPPALQEVVKLTKSSACDELLQHLDRQSEPAAAWDLQEIEERPLGEVRTELNRLGINYRAGIEQIKDLVEPNPASDSLEEHTPLKERTPPEEIFSRVSNAGFTGSEEVRDSSAAKGDAVKVGANDSPRITPFEKIGSLLLLIKRRWMRREIYPRATLIATAAAGVAAIIFAYEVQQESRVLKEQYATQEQLLKKKSSELLLLLNTSISVKSVLVTRGDVKRGQILRPEDLVWQVWPESAIDKNYIVLGASKKPESYAGWVAKNPIGGGEPITEGSIIAPGNRGFLAAVLRPGMRAISVPVTVTSGISGFIFPGDQVDLMVTYSAPAPSSPDEDHRVAETVLRNIRVIAIDQRLESKASEAVLAHTATFEVTQKQSEIIALASEIGKVALSLRSLVPSVTTEKPSVAAATATYSIDSEISPLLLKNITDGDKTILITRASRLGVVASGAHESVFELMQ